MFSNMLNGKIVYYQVTLTYRYGNVLKISLCKWCSVFCNCFSVW